MSESFRPHESSSIDEGLRIRLEGAVEVLERALRLLDSVAFLMGRDEPSPEEMVLLQDGISQLARIEAAVSQARKHGGAQALTNAVDERMKAALLAANARLRVLGRVDIPALSGAVSAVFELVKRQGLAPRPNERRLLESRGVPWSRAILVASVIGAISVVTRGASPFVLAAAFSFLIGMTLILRRPWVLLPDRLYLPARRGAIARDVLPRAIEGLAISGDVVTAQLGDEAVQLRTNEPEKLVTMLCLLKGPWLSWLKSPANWSMVIDAVDENTKENGRALLTIEGVLFVPYSRTAQLARALTSDVLPVAPALDEMLRLIAHLPVERWPVLAAHLAATADARWFPKGASVVEDSVLGAMMSTADARVRLAANAREGAHEVKALVAELRR